MEAQANVERVVIVGAGLAGLTVAYHLKRLGIKSLILDKGGKIGASWSARHQQLTLNTHRSVSHLPGLQYQSGTPAFPRRDDVVRHLESFAQRHAFPIRFNVDVTGISKAGSAEVQLRRLSDRSTLVVPDKAALKAFGRNVLDPAKRADAARAGLRQSADVVEQVRAVWPV